VAIGFPSNSLSRENFNNGRKHDPLYEAAILVLKGGVENMPSTKIEFNAGKIARMQGLDELAALLFQGNRAQQKIFLAIFIEIKYAKREFVPFLKPLCDKYGFSPRMLETVRSKMRRMGIIDHVSRFNKAHGYKEGWVLSSRFNNALKKLADLAQDFKDRKDVLQERKDQNLFNYI